MNHDLEIFIFGLLSGCSMTWCIAIAAIWFYKAEVKGQQK